jgi:hypothetical protein
MKLNKKSKIARTTVSKLEYKVVTRGLKDWYWSEGIMFYPKKRLGFKNSNRQLMSFQMRMYKTWKHNRKTQWKN